MSTISAGVTVPTALNLSGDTTGALTFQVSGTVTAATISAVGNFGIGAAPTYTLDVNVASATFRVRDASGGNDFSIKTIAGPVSLAGSRANTAIGFMTNDTERMRIDSSGNVGIGTASPGTKLDVYSSSTTSTLIRTRNDTTSVYLDANNGYSYLNTFSNHPMLFGTNNAERMRISAAGYVAIGRATTDTVRLFVQGSTTGSSDFALSLWNSAEAQLMYVRNDGLITTGAAASSPYNNTTGSAANMFVDSSGLLYRSTSSLRYKSDVTDAAHGLADVLKLRSVTYKGKNDGDKVFGGLIAEEVHDAGLTEFVAYDKEGQPDALHYGNMVALAFKAIQELKAENDALKARIEALETK